MAYNTIDRSNDWKYVDGIETLTLRPQNRDCGPVSGVKAKRSPYAVSESADTPMETDIGFARWNIYKSTMEDKVLKNGDWLEDEDCTVHVVVAVQDSPDGVQYLAATREGASDAPT